MTDELTERVAQAIAENDANNVYGRALPTHYRMARAAIEAFEAAPQPAPVIPILDPAPEPTPELIQMFREYREDVETMHQIIYKHVYNILWSRISYDFLARELWLATEKAANEIAGK